MSLADYARPSKMLTNANAIVLEGNQNQIEDLIEDQL